MKLSAAVIAALGLSTSASALSIFRGDEIQQSSIHIKDELDVPGQSPLKFCAAERGDDIITIEKVVLSPNPPEAGATLTIEATGTVKETIEDGAYVNLQVKYGYIRLINTQADLCKEIKNVDLDCPIEKGKIAITKAVELPKEIPPGKYTVEADVFDKDKKHITCLTATVVFARGGSMIGSIDL
ncbi:putative phosphatidylglycerol/phosphatidylinositol transfer protein [Bombardia bombarda]|uniref:Phosphatidylglycerol/phosphatidylinositol transfer protein n=1 Tax=Bombardia bombarda TaxID=252184 RepID=A0AA39XB10_9PEZI|nr:putative phosphatidylglycerol/phosphatidylinositol transfer protein [Bombardia bombarda]